MRVCVPAFVRACVRTCVPVRALNERENSELESKCGLREGKRVIDRGREKAYICERETNEGDSIKKRRQREETKRGERQR